jgi:DNA-binding CsgD family transcriptional regulator
MQSGQFDLLTESVYDAAVDPAGWARVMTSLHDAYSTRLEGFYFLDFKRSAMKAVYVGGLTDFYRQSFTDRYFTKDNPWTFSDPLHKPGVIRTDERLAAYFKDPQILRKSTYYNDWMRPQGLDRTLGTTLLNENGVIANLTLLRDDDVGRYEASEVRSFGRICQHLRRAVRLALKLNTMSAQGPLALEALDYLAHGAVFLDERGRLLYANSAAEQLIRRGDALTVRGGRLIASDALEQEKLRLLIQGAVRAAAAPQAPAQIVLHRHGDARALTVSAVRLSASRQLLASWRPVVFLLIVDPAAKPPGGLDLLSQTYRFTPSEARLAQAMLAGGTLRQAADLAGMTYETARWYLKLLFQKTGTRRQAELVTRLIAGMAAPLRRPH